MRATVMYGAGDVRIENVPDPAIIERTDAIIRVVRACICGSDLWPYNDMPTSETGRSMGHEAIGVVTDVGSDVGTVKPGDVVVMPFAISDGTCEFCQEGLQTVCVHVGFFGNFDMNGAQAEALRIPYADGTLYRLDVGEDDVLMPSLLTLSDVIGTGHHAAVAANARRSGRGGEALGQVPTSDRRRAAPPPRSRRDETVSAASTSATRASRSASPSERRRPHDRPRAPDYAVTQPRPRP